MTWTAVLDQAVGAAEARGAYAELEAARGHEIMERCPASTASLGIRKLWAGSHVSAG
jgi:hypothetical protein